MLYCFLDNQVIFCWFKKLFKGILKHLNTGLNCFHWLYNKVQDVTKVSDFIIFLVTSFDLKCMNNELEVRENVEGIVRKSNRYHQFKKICIIECKKMELEMNVLDLRAVTCKWNATPNLFLWIVKASFLKRDFVVKRKLYAVHYLCDFLFLFFFYEKVKNLFGCICVLCNRPNHNTSVYSSSGSNSNTYSELYVRSAIIQHLNDTWNTSISGAETNSFGSLTATSSSKQQRTKNVSTRHQAGIKEY